ncbi:GGDEF domain-containing protein [Microbacterium esteraromaticum]|uniref:GGDEF domain-containing protein n=1 Tax=Microbacterium esteraromaticum TaxID=57043 RepID=UPI002367571F|nr:GGDEF domain-containing protein [Microbacterium esteraromaticum]WDH79101.1 GGDEF domain-containing protein [Microbacterium esteraromaticum]
MDTHRIALPEADEMRWLRSDMMRGMLRRTSTYSIVTAALMLLYSALGLAELFEDDISLFEVVLSWAIFAGGLLFALLVAVGGKELPRWVGLGLVVAHTSVSVYYLGFSDERQNAIAALQEAPIMAMYFSWFYGARLARPGWLIILGLLGAAMLAGPFAGPDADQAPALLGPVNIISAGLFTWLCLEAGLFVRHRVRLESNTDELTGVLNRRGFLGRARGELRRAHRYRRPVSIALIDLDKFKEINDGAGHAAGDDLLKTLTAQWISLSRSSDTVGRLGGDEFALLLPETDEQDARVVLRRMRGLASHPWSWGVVQALPSESVDDVLARADAQMYDRKRSE